jgi:hypothetical protein
MALPVSFRWDEEFVKRVDVARGDVSRSLWVRRAVEERLAGSPVTLVSPPTGSGVDTVYVAAPVGAVPVRVPGTNRYGVQSAGAMLRELEKEQKDG